MMTIKKEVFTMLILAVLYVIILGFVLSLCKMAQIKEAE